MHMSRPLPLATCHKHPPKPVARVTHRTLSTTSDLEEVVFSIPPELGTVAGLDRLDRLIAPPPATSLGRTLSN